MKALQSELARKVLADRQARTQLRRLTSDARQRSPSRTGASVATQGPILLQDEGHVRRLTAVVVPKAA